MSGDANRKFVDELLATVPELRAVYDEHLRDNDELLPHVFMGNVTRLVVTIVREGRDDLLPSIGRIFDAVERALDLGDAEVQNLVAVSFVENLAAERTVVKSLGARIGPMTRVELQKS